MAVNPVHGEEIGPSTSSSLEKYIKQENEQCHSYEDIKQEFMDWDAEVNIIILLTRCLHIRKSIPTQTCHFNSIYVTKKLACTTLHSGTDMYLYVDNVLN